MGSGKSELPPPPGAYESMLSTRLNLNNDVSSRTSPTRRSPPRSSVYCPSGLSKMQIYSPVPYSEPMSRLDRDVDMSDLKSVHPGRSEDLNRSVFSVGSLNDPSRSAFFKKQVARRDGCTQYELDPEPNPRARPAHVSRKESGTIPIQDSLPPPPARSRPLPLEQSFHGYSGSDESSSNLGRRMQHPAPSANVSTRTSELEHSILADHSDIDLLATGRNALSLSYLRDGPSKAPPMSRSDRDGSVSSRHVKQVQKDVALRDAPVFSPMSVRSFIAHPNNRQLVSDVRKLWEGALDYNEAPAYPYFLFARGEDSGSAVVAPVSDVIGRHSCTSLRRPVMGSSSRAQPPEPPSFFSALVKTMEKRGYLVQAGANGTVLAPRRRDVAANWRRAPVPLHFPRLPSQPPTMDRELYHRILDEAGTWPRANSDEVDLSSHE